MFYFFHIATINIYYINKVYIIWCILHYVILNTATFVKESNNECNLKTHNNAKELKLTPLDYEVLVEKS